MIYSVSAPGFSLESAGLPPAQRILPPFRCIKLYKTFGFGQKSSINLYKNPSTKRRVSCLTTYSGIGRSLHPREHRRMHPAVERFFPGRLHGFSDPRNSLLYPKRAPVPAIRQREHIIQKLAALRYFKQTNTALIFFLAYKRTIPSSSQFHSGRAKPCQVIFRSCFGTFNVPKRLLPKL